MYFLFSRITTLKPIPAMKSLKLLFVLAATMLVGGQVWGQSPLTLNLTNAKPGEKGFDGLIYRIGNQFGDVPTYCTFTGTGAATATAQLFSPGEGASGINKDITSGQYVFIRPNTSINAVDASLVRNFKGTITGSNSFKSTFLTLTVSAVSPSSGAAGAAVTVSFRPSSPGGIFPSGVIFKPQILIGNTWQDLPNSVPQYVPGSEEIGFSVGGTRTIAANITGGLAAGAYGIRVLTENPFGNVISTNTVTYTVSAPAVLKTAPTSLSPTPAVSFSPITVCQGGTIQVNADVVDDGNLAGLYYANFYDASGQRKYQAVTNSVGAFYVGTKQTAPAGQYTQSNKIQFTIDLNNSGFAIASGTYYLRIYSTKTEEGGPTPISASNSSQFAVRARPTATIATLNSSVNTGQPAAIQLTFTGDAPWSFNYNDLTKNVDVVNTTTNPASIYVNPSADFTFTPAMLLNFRNNTCGTGTVSGSASIKVVNPLKISAASISTPTLSGGFYCPGSQIQVAFTLTGGAVATGNTYKVQMTDKDGNNFRDIPTTGTGSPLTATLQDGNFLSDKYRVRVIVSNPALTSDPSAAFNINRAGGPGVQDVSYCQGQQPTPLGASASAGVSAASFKWYDIDGNQKATGATGPTPAASGNQVFQVGQDVNGCQSTWSRINVTFKGKSGNPQPNNREACQFDAPVTLSASGQNLQWFDSNGTPQSGAPTLQTTSAGVQTYQVSQDDNGCRSDRVNVTLTVKARPGAPAAVTPGPVCQYTPNPAVLAATPASGGAVRWYSQASGNAGQTDQAPRPDAQNAGSQTFFASQIVNGCESADRAPVTQVISRASDPPTTQPLLYCRNDPATALTATGTDLRWNGPGVAADSPTAPTPPTSQVQELTYLVSQIASGNTCRSQPASLKVSIVSAPAVPTVQPVDLCQGGPSTTLTAGGASLIWYSQLTGGSPIPTPTPSTAQAGVQSFYVVQKAGNCESPSRAKLDVKVFAVPAAPTVTTPPALCQNVVATNQSVVAAVAAGTQSQKWYETATSTASSAAPAAPVTTQASVQNFFVTQTTNNCESSRAKIDLTVNAAPTPPTAPAPSDLLRCQIDAARPVGATGAAGNTLRWYSTASGAALPNPATGQLAAPSPPATVGVYTFYVTQTDGNGCQSLQQPISATIAATPAAPGVTAAQFACLNDAARQLTAQGVTGTAFAWNGPGLAADSPTAPIPPTGAATTLTYSVVQKLGTCTSPVSSIAFTVRPLPGAPVVSSTTGPGVQAACIGQELILRATGASGSTVRWYKTPALTDQPQNNPLSLPTTAPGNTTYYTTQTDGNGCQSPATPLDVRVRTQAAATLTGDGTVIGFDSTAIRIRLSGDGPYTISLLAVGSLAAKTVITFQNPYIWWVTPSFTLPGSNTTANGTVITRSSTYSVSVANDCGAGQAVAPYTLIVQTPLATTDLGAETVALKAYPNPTSGLVTVAWVAPERQVIRLEVVSTQGQAVWQAGRIGTGNWQTEILSLGQYPAGQYVLRITDGSTGTARLRVIKQ